MIDEKLIEEAQAGLRAFDEYWGDGGPVDAACGRPWELIRRLLDVFEKAHTPTDDEREAPTEEDWRAAHQDGGVIFAKVRGSGVPVLLMRGEYGSWSSETRRYRSADVEEIIKVYRWVPAGMQAAWASEIVADFRRSEVPEPSAEQRIGCNLCGEALPDGEPHICSHPQGEPSDAQGEDR